MESSGFRIVLTQDDHFTKDSEIYHMLSSIDHVDQLCTTFRGCGACSGGDEMAEMQINMFSHVYFRDLYTQCGSRARSGWVAS